MKTNITLSPWGQISGTLIIGQQPAGGRDIRLELTRANFLDPLAIFYSAKPTMLAILVLTKCHREISKSVAAKAAGTLAPWRRMLTFGQANLKTVQMTSNGRAVTAQIEIAPGLGAVRLVQRLRHVESRGCHSAGTSAKRFCQL